MIEVESVQYMAKILCRAIDFYILTETRLDDRSLNTLTNADFHTRHITL